MRIYARNYLFPPTAANFSFLSIDQEQRLPIGIVIGFDPFILFQVLVYAMESDDPYDPDAIRPIPEIVPNPGPGSSYLISYRDSFYTPGTAPPQTREVKSLTLTPVTGIDISIPDLDALLQEIQPTDTTGFSRQDYYDHITKENGTGPQIRALIIDARDITY